MYVFLVVLYLNENKVASFFRSSSAFEADFQRHCIVFPSVSMLYL